MWFLLRFRISSFFILPIVLQLLHISQQNMCYILIVFVNEVVHIVMYGDKLFIFRANKYNRACVLQGHLSHTSTYFNSLLLIIYVLLFIYGLISYGHL